MLSIFNKSYYLRDLLTDFVDIHNHILPGIDDGAKTVEDSITLIKELHTIGITRFINTPHTMNSYYPNTSESILDASRLLKLELKTHNLEHIVTKASSEYMMDSNFEALLENNSILPLHNNYILVEMSYLQPPINLEEIIYKINLAGYQPVLAHPERYAYYHNNLEYYKTLKTLGCLFQLNMLSLSNHYGIAIKKTAHLLLKTQMIDFIGSDTHHIRHIETLKTITLKKQQLDSLTRSITNTKSVFKF